MTVKKSWGNVTKKNIFIFWTVDIIVVADRQMVTRQKFECFLIRLNNDKNLDTHPPLLPSPPTRMCWCSWYELKYSSGVW